MDAIKEKELDTNKNNEEEKNDKDKAVVQEKTDNQIKTGIKEEKNTISNISIMDKIKEKIDNLYEMNNRLFILNGVVENYIEKRFNELTKYCEEILNYFKYITLINSVDKKDKYEIEFLFKNKLSKLKLIFNTSLNTVSFEYFENCEAKKITIFPVSKIDYDTKEFLILNIFDNFDKFDKEVMDRLNDEVTLIETDLTKLINHNQDKLKIISNDKISDINKKITNDNLKEIIKNIEVEDDENIIGKATGTHITTKIAGGKTVVSISDVFKEEAVFGETYNEY